MNPLPTLQSMIFALEHFWAEQGCVIWQPYYSQVGAGTMNPATFLRVLGPEPWRVAYVEPSIRPDDGRYGENPNRMQQHYQYQVILKPDPGDPQELYLESLAAIGIEAKKHDIRFVEDNWESPVLGAWGLGWEVWLDGLEITQFTYFQQAGGIELEPVSVELTYGTERILMALQGVGHFAEIRWNDQLTYGDLNLAAEQEHSKYYFELADVERLRSLFEEYEAEAISALGSGLVLPAYDQLLKCSQTFNVLDTRGAIGVTERAGLFGRMRNLSRQVATAYLQQREDLGHPFSQKVRTPPIPSPQEIPEAGSLPQEQAHFLLEIGTEELPATDLEAAIEQLHEAFQSLLEAERLACGEIQVMGTPRRLVVYLADLIHRQASITIEKRGPPVARGVDEGGNYTPAAIGFARSAGVEPAELLEKEHEGGRYLFAKFDDPGRETHQILEKALPSIVGSLRFEKAMRWNKSGAVFSRPVRWLVALHADSLVPFTYAGVQAGRHTRKARPNATEWVEIRDPDSYFALLPGLGVLLDGEARKQLILEQLKAAADSVSGEVDVDADLLQEVANLVETPYALLGSFNASHLDLPREVLIAVMKKHQRFFPVQAGGRLLPYFVAICNGEPGDESLVARGYEQVVEARFADAAYFYKRDLRIPLEAHNANLTRLTFQTELGSMLDKVVRIENLVDPIGRMFGVPGREREVATRAAHLCKADLATEMVVDMTSLQGIMGSEYALQAGESQEVAQAIWEHYLPRFAADVFPESQSGLLLGLADRLDTLIGLFGVGLQPSGTRDPYALRRTAIGLIQLLLQHEISFDLRKGLELAAVEQPVMISPTILRECMEFIMARERQLFLSMDHAHDVVEAVLAEQSSDPARALQAIQELEGWVAQDQWSDILQAYARCARITRDQSERFQVNPSLFKEPTEQALFAELEGLASQDSFSGSMDRFLRAFTPLVPVIHAFFEEILVMAEQEKLRENRIGLVQQVVVLAEGVADFSRMEGF